MLFENFIFTEAKVIFLYITLTIWFIIMWRSLYLIVLLFFFGLWTTSTSTHSLVLFHCRKWYWKSSSRIWQFFCYRTIPNHFIFISLVVDWRLVLLYKSYLSSYALISVRSWLCHCCFADVTFFLISLCVFPFLFRSHYYVCSFGSFDSKFCLSSMFVFISFFSVAT